MSAALAHDDGLAEAGMPSAGGGRIAHVNFTVERSVDGKLEDVARTARRLRLPLDVIVFSLAMPSRCCDNLQVWRLPGASLGRRLGAKVQWPFRLAWAAERLARGGYDAVILRYPKLPLGGPYFLRRVAVPVITEHHTHEVMEILAAGGVVRRGAVQLETLLRRRFLPRVRGIIGVTPEIRALVQRDAPGVPGMAIANGVALDRVPLSGFQPFDGQRLTLFAASAAFEYWQGIDRLLEGLLAYRGPVTITVTLAGHVPHALDALVDRCQRQPGIRIVCPGPVYGADLDRLQAAATLGIASLGLYRKGMAQACPLKSREYMARGLPFVYAYADPDLTEPCPFALSVPNTAAPVDMDALIAFARSLAARTGVSPSMRCFAAERLDWSCKLTAMMAFVRQCRSAAEPRSAARCAARHTG
jgi:hypothetical protein